MGIEEIKNMIRDIATHEGVDPILCQAIAGRETGYVNSKCRFEKNWKYLISPEKYSDLLGITLATETMQQMTSYCAMQIMGSVARELGFQGYLSDLNFPEIGLLFAIKKVKVLTKKFFLLQDIISAYNQGGAYKDSKGIYLNIDYVQNVMDRFQKLKS